MDVLYICSLYRLIKRLKFLDHAMQYSIDIPAILELKLERKLFFQLKSVGICDILQMAKDETS